MDEAQYYGKPETENCKNELVMDDDEFFDAKDHDEMECPLISEICYAEFIANNPDQDQDQNQKLNLQNNESDIYKTPLTQSCYAAGLIDLKNSEMRISLLKQSGTSSHFMKEEINKQVNKEESFYSIKNNENSIEMLEKLNYSYSRQNENENEAKILESELNKSCQQEFYVEPDYKNQNEELKDESIQEIRFEKFNKLDQGCILDHVQTLGTLRKASNISGLSNIDHVENHYWSESEQKPETFKKSQFSNNSDSVDYSQSRKSFHEKRRILKKSQLSIKDIKEEASTAEESTKNNKFNFKKDGLYEEEKILFNFEIDEKVIKGNDICNQNDFSVVVISKKKKAALKKKKYEFGIKSITVRLIKYGIASVFIAGGLTTLVLRKNMFKPQNNSKRGLVPFALMSSSIFITLTNKDEKAVIIGGSILTLIMLGILKFGSYIKK